MSPVIDPTVYDDPAYLTDNTVSISRVHLLLSGIHCPACTYKIELKLRALRGVHSLWVNYAARRLTIEFDNGTQRLSKIVQCVRDMGYDAMPWKPTLARQKIDSERRDGLKRLGVTAVLGMQVMTIAVALYFGNASGIDDGLRHLLTATALVLTLPVLLYGARPFYVNAVAALRSGRVDMDLTVCLAITLAFCGSLATTLTGSGDTYFESICMFVFLLTGARLIETSIRQHASQTVDQLASATPEYGLRVTTAGQTQGVTVSARSIAMGDILFVTKGDTFPADGVIVKGHSRINEALLTGESDLRHRSVGDRVMAGSVNAGFPLWVRVVRPVMTSTLSRISQLADRAQAEKPKSASVTDPIAACFILSVLVITTVTALAWLLIEPSRSLPISIAVLAVACPCALSLAAPAAFSAAADTLIRQRVLPTRSGVINAMNTITDVVFDKTGTLTLPGLTLESTLPLGTKSKSECLIIARALEHSLNHPVARAFQDTHAGGHDLADDDMSVAGLVVGTQGVSGTIDETEWHLGSLSYIAQWATDDVVTSCQVQAPSARCWLISANQPVAAFSFVERIRPDSVATVKSLQQQGIHVHLLSGDQHSKVELLAQSVRVDSYQSGASPDDKLNYIQTLQAAGRRVVMVGDGINDSPALAKAEVSVAVDSASPLAAVNADLVILGTSILPLSGAISLARRTHRVVRQNLAWALIYNSLSIPLAALGLVPAWMAATGMSVSSIVVITNALQLRDKRKRV